MKNETARREIESLDFYLQNNTDDYSEESHTAMMMAVKALDQEPCEDAISRQAVIRAIEALQLSIMREESAFYQFKFSGMSEAREAVENLPPVNPQSKTGHCKECKYFKYDSVTKVDGIPLIVAHEICKRWGDGCKTKEDGYCFMFEPQEVRDNENAE